jgi:hypothetical protein
MEYTIVNKEEAHTTERRQVNRIGANLFSTIVLVIVDYSSNSSSSSSSNPSE